MSKLHTSQQSYDDEAMVPLSAVIELMQLYENKLEKQRQHQHPAKPKPRTLTTAQAKQFVFEALSAGVPPPPQTLTEVVRIQREQGLR